jgi:hypothetical protein
LTEHWGRKGGRGEEREGGICYLDLTRNAEGREGLAKEALQERRGSHSTQVGAKAWTKRGEGFNNRKGDTKA